jgi:hypothetical protein
MRYNTGRFLERRMRLEGDIRHCKRVSSSCEERFSEAQRQGVNPSEGSCSVTSVLGGETCLQDLQNEPGESVSMGAVV